MNSPWRPPRRNRTLGGRVGVTSEGSIQRRVCTQWGEGSNLGISGRFWGDLRSLDSHRVMEVI